MAIILEGANRHPLGAEIMVVDDQSTSRVVLETILRSIGDNVRVSGYDNPLAALQALESGRLPDLIVADYRMPGLDGIAFTRAIRKTASCHDLPLVIVTVVEERWVMYEALDAGATDFLTKPVDHYECKVRCRNLLTLRRQQLFIRNRASAMEKQVHQSLAELRTRERDSLERLAMAGGYKDNTGIGQLRRIGMIARITAQSLRLPGQFCETIELAALLQDVGRVGIPDTILLRTDTLTAEETRIMQSHTRIGFELLKDSPSPVLQMGATIALHHHEAFDGSGYPGKLAGEAIPLEARIVTTANTFVALQGARPDPSDRPVPETLAGIERMRNVLLDPRCVDAIHHFANDLLSADPGSLACHS